MNATPRHVLIVEDEPAHAEAISGSLLAGLPGCRVSVVESLGAFRERVAAERPDLALANLFLPDGHATEVLIAPLEEAPFPIVVITSHGNESAAVRVMKAGALDYIVKSPQAFADMPRIVERAWREWTLRCEVRNERARLSGALRAAEAGTFEWVLDTQALHWSQELLELYNWPPDRPLDMAHWREIVHPDDLGRVESAVGEALRAGKYDQEFRILLPDGRVRWLRSRATVAYEDGRPVRLAGINLDVTDRHAIASELRDVTERYSALVETSHDWVWAVDEHGRYTYASERVRDVLGYEPDEVIGLTPFDFMPSDEAERVRAQFIGYAEHQAPFVALENTCRQKNGRLVTFETSGMPVFGPDGEFRGYRGMDRDVTERKGLEAQIRQTQKLDAIGQLAGGVAHDFNNILAATMMHIELLQGLTGVTDEMRHGLRDLASEVQRAATLTRQLLMFSRRSVLTVHRLDLNEVISNILRMLRRLIGEQLELVFDASGGVLSVEGDAGMLEQVVVNLVVNARDAMPLGGRIAITTAVRDYYRDDWVRLRPGRRPGRFVTLSVTDSGIGMDEATLARIFEPFFTTKETGKGTGLGLATVHGIVAQHKGWIEVESEPGSGTCFTVFLPSLDRPAATATPVDAVQSQGGRETVLIVEDEQSLRLMAVRALTGLGYRVIEAANGREALAKWEAHGTEIDLLFTDMVMPEGITGLDLSEKLQAMKPSLATIISSGYSADFAQGGQPARPGVAYLPKPYSIAVLGRLIRRSLDMAAGRH